MIVMKFGGTSVEDARAIERVAAIVKARLPQKPVVVVSAMARVTDTLLTMARAAGAGERKTALKLCRSLQERHYNTASELLGTALFTEFHSELGADFEALDELLRGISAVGDLTPRTTDHVAAFGEILSSKIVAAAFAAHGLNSEFVDAREVLVTDSNYMQAVPLEEETNARLQTKVKPLLDAGQVPVIGGFVGANHAGVTTTIGRGGSDFSAAIVGAGLSAERIEIWTDVDGIEKYSGLCPQFTESIVRGNEDNHSHPANKKYFQGYRCQEAHHYCGCGGTTHAAGPRFSARDLRGVRSAQSRRRRGLHLGSQRFADRGFKPGNSGTGG
jgi:aspartate kinase